MLITIFAPRKVHLLEIAGVRDALFEANCKMASGPTYRVRLVTEQGVPEESASGIGYMPDAGIADVTEPCDTLIVAGPYGVPEPPSEATMQWLREQAARGRGATGPPAQAPSCWHMRGCWRAVAPQPIGNMPNTLPPISPVSR